MSGSTRSGFTVTLGRSGRVVRKAGGLSEEGFRNDSSMTGSKRSIRDRLGGSSDDRYHPYNNKRQRGEGLGTSNSNDMHLHKDDLRFKLMKKNTIRQSENTDSHGNIDLRDKLLSRTSRPSVDSKTIRPPESTARGTGYPLVEPRETGITRHPMLESRNASILGQYPSSRNPSDLPIMEPPRSYSSWTLDNLRRRSPERLYHSSSRRALSPERSREDLQRRPIRACDDGRSSSMRMTPPRPVSSSPFLTRSSLPAGPVKSSVPLPSHYSQTSGIVHKIPSTGEEHLTVDGFLQSLGLEKYAIFFKAEEIDMKSLKQLGDNDLKELGIPMGPRKKILQTLVARSRRHP